MAEGLRVLIVEDSEDDALLIARALGRAGLAPEWERVDTAEQMRAALAARDWDLILCDHMMPHFSSVEALEVTRASGLDIPFIVVSGKIGEETAVAAMKAGAHDYVMKSNLARLAPAIERELREAAARRKYRDARIEWRAVFDAVRGPVFVHDREFRVLRANLAYAERAGLAIKQVIGRVYWEVFPQIGGPLPGCTQALGGECGPMEEEFTLPTGEVFVSRAFPVRAPNGAFHHSVHVLEDVTERKQAEEHLLRLNRTLRLLSECNEALVRAASEADLIGEVCRILAEHGGYRLVWVGFVEEDEQKSMRAAAAAGEAQGYLEGLRVSWDEANNTGRGTVGSVVRNGRYAIARDLPGDSTYSQWKGRAREFGFRSQIVLPLATGEKVFGALSLFSGSAGAFDPDECGLLTELANDLAYGILALRMRTEHEKIVARLARSMEGTIQAIASTVEMRDPYTAGHQRRVAELAVQVAREMGLSNDAVHGIHLAGVVHDVGKIQVPSEILSKPTKLTEVEYEIIKMHAEAGYEILKDIDFPWPIAQAVLQHHERLNGSGYPRGLKEKDILIEARILAVADTVEAMASHRPYRPARGVDAALEEIAGNRGRYYDPEVVDACVRLFREKGFAFSR